MPVSTAIRRLFSQCRLLESGSPQIALSESEMFALFHLCVRDLGWNQTDIELPPLADNVPAENYYFIPFEWFTEHHDRAPNNSDLLSILAQAVNLNEDFALYYQNLCMLHKRRLKYQGILQTQMPPTIDQIGPRSLLEYGVCEARFLFSWMIWRKWIFDIDNRVVQETGYLFEPILASCLGGDSVSARKSPVKRLGADGHPTARGRQIDCYVGDLNRAYEFKLRVTIAASGQGRFAEELSFPAECRAAGLTPILLVLDATHSSRLDELSAAFENESGRVFIGDEAWEHMEQLAGEIMSVFLETYIRPPLSAMSVLDGSDLQDVKLTWSNEFIAIETADERYSIPREA